MASCCALLLIGLVVAGCASAGAKQTRQHVIPGLIAQPDVMLVYDFETGTPQTPQDRAHAAHFAEQFVGMLKK